MIIIKLKGGLGNQMFQYACTKRLALKHNTELKVDLSFLNDPENNKPPFTKRVYELNKFKVDDRIATDEELSLFKNIIEIKYKSRKNKILTVLKKTKINPFSIVLIQDTSFHKEILFLPDNVLLEGWFTDERYFIDVREELLRLYTPLIIDDKFLPLMNSIIENNSVSMHFRRGDYLTNKDSKNYHGMLTLDYYNKAIEIINKRVKNPKYFIFSNDIDWVKKNFKPNVEIYHVENHPENDNCIDIYLMSLCKHNIIAHSSFSWWGAWLNKNKNKIVICPQRWTKVVISSYSINPKKWIKIKNELEWKLEDYLKIQPFYLSLE
jgi:hypothetical protein